MIKDVNEKDVFKIKMRGKSVALNILEEEQAIVSQENNVTALWHKRLGHFHHNGVLYMKKNQLAGGLPDLKLPTKALQKKTPFEAWFGYKPLLLNLKIFGCLCFCYVPQVKRDKLDKKTKAGIFVGYNSQSKTYRVYMPHVDKIIVSRDVKFMEDDKWSWDAKKNQNFEFLDENIDDIPVKGTKSLYDIYQRYVKSTFLNGYLEEEIFVEQPEGFVVKGKEDKVYQLKKALINECLMDKFKVEMEEVFEMTDLGDMSYFLGMEVHRIRRDIHLSYAMEILKSSRWRNASPQPHL
ncbi:hypothetical protein AAG906_033455 [Vitis piasezkii]